jgi:signal transduction histidine kinase
MRRWLHRLLEAALRVPVFVKIMGLAAGLMLLVAVAVSWQVYSTWNRLLLEDLEVRARLTARDLAAHAGPLVATRNAHELRHTLLDTQARTPGLAYVLVLDEAGEVIATTVPADTLPVLRGASVRPLRGVPRTTRVETALGPVHDVAMPMADGRGVVRVGLTEEHSRVALAALARKAGLATLAICGLGALAAWGLSRVITSPLDQMVQLARAVREGRYDGQVSVSSGDELGTLAAAFNDMTRALAEKESMRQELLGRVIAAGEDERRRVARDLHDDTGQMLVSLIAGLGAAEAAAPGDAERARLAELRDVASRTHAGIHDLSVALRPSLLDDIGFGAALCRHATSFAQRFGVAVHFRGLEAGPRLPPETETALYRIGQEALSNAVRHGRATAVHFSFLRLPDTAVLEIEDDGQGFDALRVADARREERLGLLGIQERAALLGGVVEVGPGLEAGTIVRVALPLRGGESGDEDPSPDRG